MDINIGQQTEYAGYKPQIAIGLDKTLTKQGYAADAKAVGLAIQGISGEYVPIQSDDPITITSADTVTLEADNYFVQVDSGSIDISNAGNNGLWVNELKTELYTEYSGITLGATNSNPHIKITAGDDDEQLQGDITLKAGGQGNIYLDGIVYINSEASATDDDIAATRRWVENNSRSYQVFHDSWDISNTTAAFCASIVADSTAKAGMAYLGVIHCNDLPGLVQGECIVEILSQGANGKDMHLTLTSLEVPPYHWEYNYAYVNGQYINTGWIGYQTELTYISETNGAQSSVNISSYGLSITSTAVGIDAGDTISLNAPSTIRIEGYPTILDLTTVFLDDNNMQGLSSFLVELPHFPSNADLQERSYTLKYYTNSDSQVGVLQWVED